MRHNASYWYYKSCQHYFSGRKKVNRNELVEFYLSGNHTLREVAEKYGVSISSVQRYIKQTSSKVIILADSASTSIVVQMDTTYWGRDFGVVIFLDAATHRVLHFRFLRSKERVSIKPGSLIFNRRDTSFKPL